MYSITNLFSVGYWFGEAPLLNNLSLYIMVIVFGLMLISGVIFNNLSKSQRYTKFLSKGLLKIAKLLSVMGVLAFLLLFFRYEFVVFLSRRFMFGFWFVGLLVWVIFIIKYFVKVVPKQTAEKIEQDRIKKYLP